MSEEKTTLFGLVGEYKELYNMLTEEDADEQIVKDTLEGIEGEIEVKASGYMAVLNTLDMEIEACKKHRDEWDARLKARENGKKRLKQRIIEALTMMGKTELDADGVKFKLVNVGGLKPLVFDESKVVPERFTKLTIETDNKAIRDALEAGEELDFVAYGERGKVLKIK